MDSFSHLTVLSLEQATTLPYLTMHLAQEGMRVIRVENPPRGDPNRWIGAQALDEEGMNIYFFPNNAGKEALTLNLASQTGREILHTLIQKLPVDIFATNQRPKDYAKLGIDYDTLRALKPDLIWVGITGFGPESNEPAYDPVIQARAGWMDITGEPDRAPMVFGLPLVDLGAGEQGYGQVMRALYLRERTGKGSRVDISMFQSAVSWMVSPFILAGDFDQNVSRRGNTHQFFGPVSVYPTRDGFIYLAIGNDKQWANIVATPEFQSLALEKYQRNAGRMADLQKMNEAFGEVMQTRATDEWLEFFNALGVPVSRVNTMREVIADESVQRNMLTAHDARSDTTLHYPAPVVVTNHLRANNMQIKFPPRLGEDNEKIFGALGYDVGELKANGVI
ncbi:CoA transferase [Anaerolineae bacterium CFX7]|nr:CoA transferase [Anaerolineae bacterium CFX7]